MALNDHDLADVRMVLRFLRARRDRTRLTTNDGERLHEHRIRANGCALMLGNEVIGLFIEPEVARLAASAVNVLPRLIRLIEQEVVTVPHEGIAGDLAALARGGADANRRSQIEGAPTKEDTDAP